MKEGHIAVGLKWSLNLNVSWLCQKSDAFNNLFDLWRGKGADLFGKIGFIDRDDLGYVDNAVFGEAALAFLKEDIAGGICPLQIGGQSADHYSVDPAFVEDVILNHHMGVSVSRLGTMRLAQINPVDVPLSYVQNGSFMTFLK